MYVLGTVWSFGMKYFFWPTWLRTSWTFGVRQMLDLLISCLVFIIKSTRSKIYSAAPLCRHLDSYIGIPICVNSIISHISSARRPSCKSQLSAPLVPLLLFSACSPSSPYQRAGRCGMPPRSHSVMSVTQSNPVVPSNPCKSQHLRAAVLPLRQNYAHVEIGESRGEAKQRGAYTLQSHPRLCLCRYAPFRRSRPSRLTVQIGAVFATLKNVKGKNRKSCFVLGGKDKILGWWSGDKQSAAA